jgi:DNA primase
MNYMKDQCPDPVEYFGRMGSVSKGGRNQWRTTTCQIHGGSDSLRFRVDTGGWVCMSCGAKGGSVIDHYMQLHCCSYTEAAKALGVRMGNGDPGDGEHGRKRAALPARDAIGALHFESHLVALTALNLAKGTTLNPVDLQRLLKAAGRIQLISEDFK